MNLLKYNYDYKQIVDLVVEFLQLVIGANKDHNSDYDKGCVFAYTFLLDLIETELFNQRKEQTNE